MFEQSTLSPGSPAKRAGATFVGLIGQVCLLGAAVLGPIISPQVLPRAQLITGLFTPAPPQPPIGERVTRVVPVRTRIPFRDSRFSEPRAVPKGLPTIEDVPEPAMNANTVIGGIPGGSRDGIEGGVLDTVLNSVPRPVPHVRPPAPVAATPKSAPPEPVKLVKVGGHVRMARAISQPRPEYPPAAKIARIAGTVELEGIIATDGHIRSVRVVSGHPFLAKAAMDAVSRWIYEPTLLNNEPVEVLAPITVTFRMN